MVRPTVSVCMATYEGARWVREQLTSILDQLGPSDEVVVVDDASRDDTADVVRALGDARVRLLVQTTNGGYVRAFERALGEARGDLLLLSDQDDVWVPGRVELLSSALADVDVVASNLSILGDETRGLRGPLGQHDWRLRSADSRRHARNVLGVLAGNRPYYGCAMALRRTALATVLPFPAYLDESHDLWIALYGNLARSVRHLDERTVRRRLHGENATPDRPRGVGAALRSRALLLRAVCDLRARLR